MCRRESHRRITAVSASAAIKTAVNQCIETKAVVRQCHSTQGPRKNGMAQDQNNLLWLDMEMTGLDPDKDRIIEVAVVVTDSALNTLAEAPVLVVRQPDEVLSAMDDWNKSTHARTGLIDKVKGSVLEARTLERPSQARQARGAR